MKKNLSSNQGFTLVELLVVIGILLVLISIMFPFASNAMDRARTAKCLGNMRKWALAANMYLIENSELPGEGIGGGSIDYFAEDAWFNILAEELKMRPLSQLYGPGAMPRPGQQEFSIYFCPFFKMDDLDGNPNGRQMVFNYAYNLWIDHPNRNESSHTDYPGIPNGNLHIEHIQNPSEFVLFGEVASFEFDNMAARHMVYRHNDGEAGNLCFADGSARTYDKADIYVDPAGAKDKNRGVIWDPMGDLDYN